MTTASNPMNNKKTAYALFLSILVVLVYTELVIVPMRPAQPKASAVEATASGTSTNTSSAQTAVSAVAPVEYQAPSAQPSASVTPVAQQAVSPVKSDAAIEAAIAAAPSLSIESDLVSAKLSLLGGRLTSLKLKGFKEEIDGSSLVEIVRGNNGHYPLGVSLAGVSDRTTSYAVVAATAGTGRGVNSYQVPESEHLEITLAGTLPNGSAIKKTLIFSPGTFLFEVKAKIENTFAPDQNIWIEWTEFLPKEEQSKYNPEQFITLGLDGSIERITPDAVTITPLVSQSKWIAFGDNYFTSALIHDAGARAEMVRQGAVYRHRMQGGSQEADVLIFAGSKNSKALSKAGHELHRSVDLGWFGFIGQPILILLDMLYGVLGNYGLAIILLTLLMKTALLPLTKTSFESMKKMQDIQPEISALRERIKDPAEVQQEMMALYKRRGVNPMAGCLPMLLQMPIFLGMFNALRSSIELRHAPFALWINDLAAPESLLVLGIPIPVMILLMGASMILQQVTTPSAGDPQQRKMMMLAPVIFTVMFIVFPFPAGLVLYMLVNNTTSILQQAAMRSERSVSPLMATIAGGIVVFGLGFTLTLL